MKRIQTIVFISICLVIISFSASAKKEEVKLFLFKGESYTYLISQENSVEATEASAGMHQKVALKIQHTVVNHLPTGVYQMEAAFTGFSTKFDSQGRKYSYNSDTVDVRNKMYKVLEFMTHVKLTYEVSAEGVVSNIKGFEVVKNRMDIDPFLKSILWSFGNTQFLVDFYNYFPLSRVGVGDKWTNSSVIPEMKNYQYDIHHTFKSETEKEIRLAHEASFKYSTDIAENDSTVNHVTQTISQQGSISISQSNKMPVSSDMIQKIQLSASQDKPSATKQIAPVTMVTKTQITRVKK